MFGVENLNVVGEVEVAGGDDAFAVLAEHDGDFVAAFELEDDALEVEEDVHDVFEDAVDLGVFVNDARNLRFRGSVADHRREENATERIAERVAVAAFERFERDDGTVGVVGVRTDVNHRGLQKSGACHGDIPACPRFVTPIRRDWTGQTDGRLHCNAFGRGLRRKRLANANAVRDKNADSGGDRVFCLWTLSETDRSALRTTRCGTRAVGTISGSSVR